MSYNAENRKIKAAVTRQKIYDSAERLIASKDLSEISVESIVKMAGVSKGSFYVHFSSKDALILSLISDHVAKLDTDYKSFLDSFPDSTSAEVLLLSFIGKITDLMIEEVGVDKIKTIYRAQISRDFDTGVVMSYDRDIYKIFSGILKRGMKQGEFKTDIPIDILTKHFLMSIRGITYEWCIRYPEFHYKAEALSHFKILLEGLRKPSASINEIETAKVRE